MKRLTVKDLPDGSRTIMCKNGGKETLSALSDQRLERQLCDVIIKVGYNVEILAHRSILAANSSYFRAMFVEGFWEALNREVHVQPGSVDPAAAQALIDFMYTGHLDLTAAAVQGLIMAADVWQMNDVKQKAEEYMERLVDENNCLGISQFAEMYSCRRMAERSLQMLKQRFPLVAQGTEFLQLPISTLQHVLSLKDLTLGPEGEDVVARALCRWLGSHPDVPPDTLTSLLATIHWAATSPSCRRELQAHPALASSIEVQQQLQSVQGQERVVREAQTTLVVIGGYLQARTGPTCPRLCGVERLQVGGGGWVSCADLPMLASSALAFNLHGHLLVCACEPVPVGNSTNRSATTTATRTDIFEYHMMRDEWECVGHQWSMAALECVDMCLQGEGAAAVCVSSSAIYLVSGSQAAAVDVQVVEGSVGCHRARLLPRPPLSPQHRHHTALVLDSIVYIMGGDCHNAGSDPVPTNAVTTFNPHLQLWEPKADMLEPRVQLSAAALNGKIYACGGFNTRRLSSLEVYDPVSDQWTALSPMTKFRSHHQLLGLNNQLWAIGGKSYSVSFGGARKVLNLCEVYDPEADRWTERESDKMNSARCAFAAVAI